MGDQEPVYFFKAEEPEFGFLCQWYPSQFKDDNSQTYKNAEQYMMYQKALTFDDVDTAEEILRTSNPRKCKALGRATKGFDEKVWNKLRSQVVEQGSYLKYTRGVDADGEGLKHKLLATENRELLEASNYDRIWGVGYSADDCRKGKKGPAPREKWGQNLLGKALMATRKRIREEDEAEAKAAHEGAVKT